MDAVIDQDPGALTDEELRVDVLRLRRQMDRLEAAFAERTSAANRRAVGLVDGHQSTPAWVAWKTGMPRGAVARVLRTADVCELLPATNAAWRSGEITSTAVDMIVSARVQNFDEEPRGVEDEFLRIATRGDHKTLRSVTRHFRACARADGSKPAPPDEFSIAFVGDRCTGRFDVTKTAGQSLCEAVEKFTKPPTVDDGASLAQRQAEGLVRMCEIALARGTAADRARPVVSSITHARTADDPSHPLTLGLFSGVIDPRERDQILCDATIVPVTTDPTGEILGVGRATPVWNRAQRRAVTSRSPHCQWPGCEMPAPWCDIHHAVSWEHGGPTDVDNGAHLCRRHHVFLHQRRDWTFTFERQHLRVFRADGSEVHHHPWTGGDWAV